MVGLGATPGACETSESLGKGGSPGWASCWPENIAAALGCDDRFPCFIVRNRACGAAEEEKKVKNYAGGGQPPAFLH